MSLEKQITFKTLNEFFQKKDSYFQLKKATKTMIPEDGEGNQGESNEYIKIYKHADFPEGVFFQETYETDSYGYNDAITNYIFVEGKEKTITIFE